MKIISIIVIHWGMDAKKIQIFHQSLESLFPTISNLPVEVLVIDNGGDLETSKWLLELTEQGKINTYIRNATNLHFGVARNQALRLCNGDFIAIVDNDIEYHPGWLEACLDVLEAYPDEKIWATPLYNVAHWLPKYWSDKKLKVGEKIYQLNSRAGSNCWVMRRKDLEEVGEFLPHRVAGTKWTEEANEKGYLGALPPIVMVRDIGFRQGYAWNAAVPIKIVLSNREEVYLNVDEFKRNNSGLQYLESRRFNPRPNIRFNRESNKE